MLTRRAGGLHTCKVKIGALTIRTLCDFMDFDTILARARGIVLSRFLNVYILYASPIYLL